MRELPRYKCHKEVGALKIKALQHNPDGSLTITPVWPGFPPFNVEAAFVPRHSGAQPEPGWWYVEYENGHVSFSPPKAFEDGYTLIAEKGTDSHPEQAGIPVDVTAENQVHTDIPAKAPKKKSDA